MKKKDANLKEKIVKNALRIFAKKGFFQTTMEDIARASRVAKGTVYLYFKDKSTLYVDIIKEHFLEGISFLQRVQKEPLTASEKLDRITHDWLDYMMKMESSFFMFSMENLNLSGKIMKAMRPIVMENLLRMVDAIAVIIRQGIIAGEFRKVDARVAALHFLNTIRTGFYVSQFLPGITEIKETSFMLYFEGLKQRR
ncbi:TetR/AcrR family transcriptional regulator [candidate division WOR-3 bacterium]|nr:TetR/AcrR family transcriptional regulator [candidate division WOR-3 bacterium]